MAPSSLRSSRAPTSTRWALVRTIALGLATTVTTSSATACNSNSLRSLAGKRILVTGGGRGIGRALALSFASRGAHVAILSRTESEVLAVAEEAKAASVAHEVMALTADVTDKTSVEMAVADVVASLGGGWGGVVRATPP